MYMRRVFLTCTSHHKAEYEIQLQAAVCTCHPVAGRHICWTLPHYVTGCQILNAQSTYALWLSNVHLLFNSGRKLQENLPRYTCLAAASTPIC